MTREEFRRLALTLPGASENAHVGNPDFRINGRVFATLDYPKPGCATVKLTLDQRETVIAAEPGVFSPVPGGWGRSGATIVALAAADEGTASSALQMACSNVTAKRRKTKTFSAGHG